MLILTVASLRTVPESKISAQLGAGTIAAGMHLRGSKRVEKKPFRFSEAAEFICRV